MNVEEYLKGSVCKTCIHLKPIESKLNEYECSDKFRVNPRLVKCPGYKGADEQ